MIRKCHYCKLDWNVSSLDRGGKVYICPRCWRKRQAQMKARAADEDLRKQLDDAFDLTMRKQAAYAYCDKATQRTNRFLTRLLLCSATIFVWAVLLSLLVGTA